METNSNNNSTPPLHNARRTAFDLASYGVAGVSGAVAVDLNVRQSMYKNFATHGIFNDLQAIRTKQYKDLYANIEKGEVHDVPSQVSTIEKIYRANIKERFEGMGIKHFGDWWHTLTRSQKLDAVVQGLTVSGIAIGALMMINNSPELERFFNSPNEKNAGTERS
jgi:hypothetical protein